MNELQIRQMQISRAKDEIRCCNELNQIYGLTLTEADITELVELRGQALRSTGRVEFGGGILPKLIRAFCKSPYVDPYNYAASRISPDTQSMSEKDNLHISTHRKPVTVARRIIAKSLFPVGVFRSMIESTAAISSIGTGRCIRRIGGVENESTGVKLICVYPFSYKNWCRCFKLLRIASKLPGFNRSAHSIMYLRRISSVTSKRELIFRPCNHRKYVCVA